MSDRTRAAMSSPAVMVPALFLLVALFAFGGYLIGQLTDHSGHQLDVISILSGR